VVNPYVCIAKRTTHGALYGHYARAGDEACAALCAELNDTQTRYPGTTLTLRYEVEEHPGTA